MPTGHCFYAACTVFATAHSRFARCRRATQFDSRRSPLNVEDAEQKLGIFNRAGDGNRTRVISLEGWGSTIELRPRVNESTGSDGFPPTRTFRYYELYLSGV